MTTILFCGQCSLRDRPVVVVDDLGDFDRTTPCRHEGTGPDQHNRTRWEELCWTCTRCHHSTPGMVRSSTVPTGRKCHRGHRGYWELEGTSRWILEMRPELRSLVFEQEGCSA